MSEKSTETTAEKKKMPVILFANQKGGVAKTTTATTVFNELNRRGYKCLFIDGDPQMNSTSTLGGKSDDGIATLYDVIFDDDTTLEESIQHAAYGDIVPGDILLADTDVTFGSIQGMRKLYSLRDKLKKVEGKYDAVIIDSNPSVSHLLHALFFASTDIIIPMLAEQYSLDGFDRLYNIIQTEGKTVNENLRVSGIVVTRYDKRKKLICMKALEDIKNKAAAYKLPVFGPIYENVAVPESQALKQPLMEYDDESTAAESYKKMVDELIKEVF